jgi:acyl dehydratase
MTDAALRDKAFDDLDVGFEVTTETRKVTEGDVLDFARLSGDHHPEHMDEAYGRASIHGERIAHGVLILAMATGEVNQTGLFERTTIGVLEMRVHFVKAVKFNDTVRSIARITGKRATSKPDRGIVTLGVTVLNQRNEAVLEGEWTLMVKRGVD